MLPTAILVSDGSAWPTNPGNLRVGAALIERREDGDVLVAQVSKDLKKRGSNSIGEYEALIHGLELATEKGYKKLEVFIDSEFIYRQLTGQYRVRAVHLRPLKRQTLSLMKTFDKITVSWHSRATLHGRIADALSRGQEFPVGEKTTTIASLIKERPAYRPERRAPQQQPAKPLFAHQSKALQEGLRMMVGGGG